MTPRRTSRRLIRASRRAHHDPSVDPAKTCRSFSPTPRPTQEASYGSPQRHMTRSPAAVSAQDRLLPTSLISPTAGRADIADLVAGHLPMANHQCDRPLGELLRTARFRDPRGDLAGALAGVSDSPDASRKAAGHDRAAVSPGCFLPAKTPPASIEQVYQPRKK